MSWMHVLYVVAVFSIFCEQFVPLTGTVTEAVLEQKDAKIA